MREINVWAYHSDFGSLCRNARLDSDTGLRYPEGNRQGQAGWHVAVRFDSLRELAQAFSNGVAMPRQFCGNWFSDCDPIARGEVKRLAILAHGDQGGVVAINGRARRPFLGTESLRNFRDDLHTVGLYTSSATGDAGSTILFAGCLAGQGTPGTRLLQAVSAIWPGRRVVAFSTVGYRHPGTMKRPGEACELPGMRDTDATAYIFANPSRFDRLWSDLFTMPWASESSTHAKVVVNGTVRRWPAGEVPEASVPPVTPTIRTRPRR